MRDMVLGCIILWLVNFAWSQHVAGHQGRLMIPRIQSWRQHILKAAIDPDND